MTQTNFPFRVSRNIDPVTAVQKLQQLLEYLRDQFDKFQNRSIRGTATIGAGGTNVVVTHSLGSATYAAVASPTVDPTVRWWISNKTATTFQLNLSGAAPVGGVSFDYYVFSA